ncbi:MAG: hypothetical protein OXQ94_16560 [Gemmatimonadota bacterium]|nr:hypothetical protein [Gemmatimonadota bacterium]
MPTRMIELHHPEVNDGNTVAITVQMTRIYCSPPDRAGRRKIGDIDVTVPLRSKEHRVLNEFEEAICGPAGIVPMRLKAGDHVGMWSVRKRQFVGDSALYTLCFSGTVEEQVR